jgi:hypothetical protein
VMQTENFCRRSWEGGLPLFLNKWQNKFLRL